MSFKNKVVIVTGASSGIGAATAVAFSAEGASVVIVGRNDTKLSATAALCTNALVIKADVTSDDEARGIIDRTVEKHGKIDILVNNAGGTVLNSIFDEDIMKSYDANMNVNLRSVFRLTSFAIPYLIKTKGNIVNMSSIAGYGTQSSSELIAYCVSKAALNQFGGCLAADLAQYGVRVNTINPGPVITDILENSGIPNIWDKLKSLTALGRVSEPQEVADLILFVASDKAKSITGAQHVCDNGLMIKRTDRK